MIGDTEGSSGAVVAQFQQLGDQPAHRFTLVSRREVSAAERWSSGDEEPP